MLAYTEFRSSPASRWPRPSVWIWMCWTPTRADEPTPFDFAAGIGIPMNTRRGNAYALNYQSGMGPI